MSKPYSFYCVICGTPFAPTKKHARCCKSECRVVLSNIMRYQDEPVAPEVIDKKEVAEKFKDVTGKEINPAALNQHTDKPKEEKAPTATEKLLKTKKKPLPPI